MYLGITDCYIVFIVSFKRWTPNSIHPNPNEQCKWKADRPVGRFFFFKSPKPVRLVFREQEAQWAGGAVRAGSEGIHRHTQETILIWSESCGNTFRSASPCRVAGAHQCSYMWREVRVEFRGNTGFSKAEAISECFWHANCFTSSEKRNREFRADEETIDVIVCKQKFELPAPD